MKYKYLHWIYLKGISCGQFWPAVDGVWRETRDDPDLGRGGWEVIVIICMPVDASLVGCSFFLPWDFHSIVYVCTMIQQRPMIIVRDAGNEPEILDV